MQEEKTSKPISFSIANIAVGFLLFCAGIILCYFFFRKYDFNELKQHLERGNFWWFIIVMLTSLFVYVLRTLRWQMLIKAANYNSKFSDAFSALSISYFVSFVVPRLGEITRCLSLKKQNNIPFTALLGTVIVERVVDIICLIVLLFITLILQFKQIIEFMKTNILTPIYENIVLKILNGNSVIIILAIVIVLVSIVVVLKFKNYFHKKTPQIVLKFLLGLRQGLTSISHLRNKNGFIIYTILIWVGYYLMTYFWFFVFAETSVLTWGACLSILAVGTVGRSVPIQGGGMGAYHFLVANVVLLYGLSADWGKTLAILIHAGQTFFTLMMGLAGLLIFFYKYKIKN